MSTRALTWARWGPQEHIVVSLSASAGQPAEERPVSRDDLRAYISEAAVEDKTALPDAERVVQVSVTLPSEKLRDGLVVVDTPGIGSVHREHTAAALGVLPKADVVLYLTDARTLMTPSDLAFVRGAAESLDAARSPERLVFVVTKIDQVTDAEAVVRDIRAQLTAVRGLSDRAMAVPVSSRSRLAYLTSQEPDDLELGAFEGAAALAGPIGWIIGSIVAVITAIVLLVYGQEKLEENMMDADLPRPETR